MKVCTKCREAKPETEFHLRESRGRYYRRNICKCCTRLRANEQYATKYKQKALEYSKKYRINNKEKITAWKIKRKEKTRLYDKKYKEKNADKIAQYNKERWLKDKDNLELKKQKRKSWHNRFLTNKDKILAHSRIMNHLRVIKITDGYVKNILIRFRGFAKEEITKEVIDSYRNYLKTYRKLKQTKTAIKNKKP